MEEFNLNYKFGADLREIPENAKSMQSYLDFLQQALQRISEPPQEDQIRVSVKLLGEVGSYGKILRKLDLAQQALEKSLALIDKHQLPIEIWAVHTIRYGDVKRFQAEYLDAQASFHAVIEMVQRKPSIAHLEDFAWQHLGKLFFDQKKRQDAEACFQKALALRKKKNIKELIDSTELALRVLAKTKGSR